MFTPDPFWEADAYDPDDPCGTNYADRVTAASDDARNKVRDSLGRNT